MEYFFLLLSKNILITIFITADNLRHFINNNINNSNNNKKHNHLSYLTPKTHSHLKHIWNCRIKISSRLTLVDLDRVVIRTTIGINESAKAAFDIKTGGNINIYSQSSGIKGPSRRSRQRDKWRSAPDCIVLTTGSKVYYARSWLYVSGSDTYCYLHSVTASFKHIHSSLSLGVLFRQARYECLTLYTYHRVGRSY